RPTSSPAGSTPANPADSRPGKKPFAFGPGLVTSSFRGIWRAACSVWTAPDFVHPPDARCHATNVASGLAREVTKGDDNDEGTESGATGRGGRLRRGDRRADQAVRRPGRRGPGGPAGPGRHGVRLPGA